MKWLSIVDEHTRECLALKLGVETRYIKPPSPWQNRYAESSHSQLWDGFLAVEVFDNLAAAWKLTAAW